MRILFFFSALAVVLGMAAVAGEKSVDNEQADAEAATDELVFLHALDNKPFEFTYRLDQAITAAVEHMHATGENLYAGDEAAIQEGEKLYMKYCKACHLKDGKGRIGPNLRDDKWKNERTGTEKGRFEIIYAGGAGAMQAFGKRIDQDQILKIMAFTDTFREGG